MDEDIMRNSLDDKEIIDLRESLSQEITQIKYPKIGKIKLDNFAFSDINSKYISDTQKEVIPQYLKEIIEEDENILILKDGNIIFQNLDEQFKEVKIMSYFDALKAQDQEVLNAFREHLKQKSNHKLLAINKAYLNSFLYIYIPKKTSIKDSLKLHIVGEKSDLIHYTKIVVDENSEFNLVEIIDNIKPIKISYVSESIVLENAKMNYTAIDRLQKDSLAYIDRSGYVYDDASLIYALGQLNNSHTINYNNIKLLGKNSYGESRNVLFTDKDNTHAITVSIEHLSPYSVGRITNHGIVKDQGHLFVDGIGKINQGMISSNSQQSTSIIILSDEAKVTANPYLLIDEFDVYAGHGAAIGKVDEEQLYYLMSRGLSKKDAERLIIFGFLYPIIEMITSEKIKESFIKSIENKLLV